MFVIYYQNHFISINVEPTGTCITNKPALPTKNLHFFCTCWGRWEMAQLSGPLANFIITLCNIKFYTNIWWGSPFSLCICFKLTKIVTIFLMFMKNLSIKHLNRVKIEHYIFIDNVEAYKTVFKLMNFVLFSVRQINKAIEIFSVWFWIIYKWNENLLSPWDKSI